MAQLPGEPIRRPRPPKRASAKAKGVLGLPAQGRWMIALLAPVTAWSALLALNAFFDLRVVLTAAVSIIATLIVVLNDGRSELVNRLLAAVAVLLMAAVLAFVPPGRTFVRAEPDALDLPSRDSFEPGADLDGMVAPSADLIGVSAAGASLRGADLRQARLAYADLRGATLSGAGLRGAVLRNADLRGADLTGADLREADLTGVCLVGANVTAALVEGATVTGAAVRGVTGADAAATAVLAKGSQESRPCRFLK